MNEEVSIAKIETQLENLTKLVQEVRDDQKSLRSDLVTRAEWEMRNQFVDSKISEVEKDVAEMKSKSAPWWTWVTVAVGIAMMLWNFAQPAIQHLLTVPTGG